MTPQPMTPDTLAQFILDLDSCDMDEVRALHQYAKGQGGDFAVNLGYRPMWRDMAQLLNRELRRYTP